MPLDVMDAHFRTFGGNVVSRAVKSGIGILGMKSMGDKFILESGTVTPIECLHFALNLPTSVVITGVDRPELVDQAVEAAKTYRPISREAVAALLAKTRTAAAEGRYELFKTSDHFDSTAHHPQWLG